MVCLFSSSFISQRLTPFSIHFFDWGTCGRLETCSETPYIRWETFLSWSPLSGIVITEFQWPEPFNSFSFSTIYLKLDWYFMPQILAAQAVGYSFLSRYTRLASVSLCKLSPWELVICPSHRTNEWSLPLKHSLARIIDKYFIARGWHGYHNRGASSSIISTTTCCRHFPLERYCKWLN